VSEFDQRRLLGLVRLLRKRIPLPRALEARLARAVILPASRMPKDVVTMNSKVRLLDLDTRQRVAVELAFPGAPSGTTPQVSVLAPLGTALLGARESDEVRVSLLNRAHRWLVERVEYQPEAFGNFAR